MRFLTTSTALTLAWFAITGTGHAQPAIRWQPGTAVLIQRGAGYGRMARLPDDSILCAYSRGRAIYVRRSTDDGRTWPDEALAVDYPQGHAANAELLVLRDGRVLLMYNERPTDGQSPYAVGVCTSNDGGRTWQDHRRIYAAGTERRIGCWEPAAVELPSGEVQLFFANEYPYPHSGEQEITRLRSIDGGRTWLESQAVSFRAGHRDGMPVPLLLAGGRRIALAIEDNGLSGRFKPAIISLPAAEPAESLPVSGEDDRRQSALVDPLPERVYAGAPYLVQLPRGETVLSVQSTEGRDASHDFTNSRMVVYVGDAEATRFAGRSVPFEALTDAPGLWNALFVKDAKTITAISGTAVDGVKGLWAIDGHVE
ncbi:MAG: exo-alpha-sialidase [Planctomycetaceae bacterium]|nr:exo-alpha-sialidase [Planctomycetaceae bacterium]